MVATANGNGKTVISGKVLRVNDRGLVLTGHDGWLNVSKFAADVQIPSVGAVVSVTLDRSGFIREIAPLSHEAPATISGGAPASTETPTTAPQPTTTGEAPDRERIITRQWAVKAAIDFYGLAEGDKSATLDDVLRIAAQLETWALRPA